MSYHLKMRTVPVFLCVIFVISCANFPGTLGTPLKDLLHDRDLSNRALPAEPRAEEDDDDGTITPNYRLPDAIVPSNYKLELTLQADAFTKNAFSGKVDITFNIDGAKTTKKIVLHSKYLTIKDVALKLGPTDVEILPGPYTIDEDTDFLEIETKNTLLHTELDYVLSITYTGILSETSMHGFYKSTYQEDGKEKYLATTQFEPAHAREAFPSFDEPQYKATFDITIISPTGYNVLGNTPQDGEAVVNGGLKTVKFKTTPRMPTYLIAFIVSEFTSDTGADVEEGVPSAVWSRKEVGETRSLAADVAPKLLNIMEDYTGFIYGDSKIGKMDEVAIPDFSAGAMENWGLVTYREADLLWDKQNSSNRNKQSVVTVVAHEFSHQWFGDLVTLKWWSDIFLNEGFATYFEYHATDQLYPDWELSQQFVVEVLHSALSVDASISSKALSYDVFTPAEISNRFDTISYDKGGAVLRMVQNILTLDHFKAGLADYISRNKFDNTRPTDLWTALASHAHNLPVDVDFPTVMDSWTNKPGYPVLSVAATGKDVTIKQTRYLLSGEDKTQWYVPINYAVSKDKKFDDTSVKTWLIPDEELKIENALADSTWIVVNNQQTGYYRVDYDDALWAVISQALKEKDFDGIHVLNRAQIVDDIFNFATDGKQNYELLFNIFDYLKNETEYYPWYPAFTGFNYFLKRVNDNKLKTALQAYILDLLANLYKSVPTAVDAVEDQIHSLKQILAYNWACKLGQEECIEYAREEFSKFKETGNRPDRNLRGVIYCNAQRYSKQTGEDWDFLWDTYLATEVASESGIIRTALGCTRDSKLLESYLEKIIEKNSAIRLQDASSAFSSVYSSNPEGIEATLQFIIKNHADIVTYFEGPSNLLSLINAVSDRLTNIKQIETLETFVETELEDTVQATARNYVKRTKTNLDTTLDLEKALKPILLDDDSGAHISVGSFTLLIMSLVTVFLRKVL